ncbi:MAG: ribbon-helix-helix protein, CopG family [Acidobacteria bacterium]|nr:ribbon-helix-helix protein, CopG family [Acidobacteriota bacterium]
MVKVTYSLDDATVRRIRRAAERLGRPQSQVVREAVAEYDARTDRLSEAERLRMLEVLDRLRSEPVTRSRAAVAAEVLEVRRSRRESSLHRTPHDGPS